MQEVNICSSAEEYVRKLFADFCKPYLHYHNLEHTEKVVKNAELIFHSFDLPATDHDVLIVSSWFHDLGHLFGPPEGHEQRSIEQFGLFADQLHLDLYFTGAVRGCIWATKMPHKPETQIQEIICDADTFNLGTPEFVETDRRLKLEMQKRKGVDLKDWDEKTFRLLQEQGFFTGFCQQMLNKGLEANIKLIGDRLKKEKK